MQSLKAVPHLGHLLLNCPKCGQRMIYLRARNSAGDTITDARAEDAHTVYIYHCAQHGPFQFSLNIPVRPGD